MQHSQKSNKVIVVSESLVGHGQVNGVKKATHACKVDSIVSILEPLSLHLFQLQLQLVNQLM